MVRANLASVQRGWQDRSNRAALRPVLKARSRQSAAARPTGGPKFPYPVSLVFLPRSGGAVDDLASASPPDVVATARVPRKTEPALSAAEVRAGTATFSVDKTSLRPCLSSPTGHRGGRLPVREQPSQPPRSVPECMKVRAERTRPRYACVTARKRASTTTGPENVAPLGRVEPFRLTENDMIVGMDQRKRGRPSKGLRTVVSGRVPVPTKDAAQRRSIELGMPMNDYLAWLIEQDATSHGAHPQGGSELGQTA